MPDGTNLSAGDLTGRIGERGYLVGDDTLAELGDGDVRLGRKRLRLMIADARKQQPIVGPTEKPSNVRIATEADEAAVLRLLIEEVQEHGERVAPIDPDRLLQHIQVGTRRQGGIVGVIDGPGAPVGCSVIVPQQWAWSQQWHLCELFLYVAPEWRHSRFAADLIKFGSWCSDFMSTKSGNRVYLLTGVMTTSMVKEKIRLYRRHANLAGAITVYPQPPEAHDGR